MARLSKSKAFAIYEDNVVQHVDDDLLEHEEAEEVKDEDDRLPISEDNGATSVVDYGTGEPESYAAVEERGEDADDERRESTMTSTTVSSFPDSYYMAENEDGMHTYQAYTPPVIRTRFRRPESVKRLQMASPPPYGYRSPRQSILSNSRSRRGTPRSARSTNAHGSPRMKSRQLEDAVEEQMHYPLVLLHISLLPLDAPWSLKSLQQLLSPETLESLRLLRSKLSDTVLQRGLLIPHPREEYELLEERLLEALDLKSERLTKCGHFRGRASGSSDGSGAPSDSGIGSSSERSDEELCAICLKHIQQSKAGVKAGNKKWIIKVYAANGLMGSSAWAAAWPDMERVDVEIMPWISDEVRQKLDRARVEDQVNTKQLLQDQELMIKEMVEREVEFALEQRLHAYTRPHKDRSPFDSQPPVSVISEAMRLEPPPNDGEIAASKTNKTSNVPQVYRPSQIPISVLLKNYLYLLLQDRRNILILGLSIGLLFFAVAMSPASDDRKALLAGEATQPMSLLSSNLENSVPEPTFSGSAKVVDDMEPDVVPSSAAIPEDTTIFEILDAESVFDDPGINQGKFE